MSGFDEYIGNGEPGQKVKVYAWQMTFGLLDMSRLKVSAHLLDSAPQYI